MLIINNSLEKFSDEFNIPLFNYKKIFRNYNCLKQSQQKIQIKENNYFNYIESGIFEENNNICDLYESYNK